MRFPCTGRALWLVFGLELQLAACKPLGMPMCAVGCLWPRRREEGHITGAVKPPMLVQSGRRATARGICSLSFTLQPSVPVRQPEDVSLVTSIPFGEPSASRG